MFHSPHASTYPTYNTPIHKVVFITNPVAGRGLALRNREIAIAEFKKLGIEVEAYTGQTAKESQLIATQAQRRQDIDCGSALRGRWPIKSGTTRTCPQRNAAGHYSFGYW